MHEEDTIGNLSKCENFCDFANGLQIELQEIVRDLKKHLGIHRGGKTNKQKTSKGN